VDLSELKDILRILEAQDVTEFELEQDGVRLRICRSLGSTAPPTVSIQPSASSPEPGPASHSTPGPPLQTAGSSSAAPGERAAEQAPVEDETAAEGADLPSPIVGTFYRASDPNSPPFVNIGDRVQVGQVLCIIEAMKLMNEIEAEMAGEILKIHPENGQPVQYGDSLFTIRPS
jgi:acetyl-CoA carboxylase biotin carboxyl carrier protein